MGFDKATAVVGGRQLAASVLAAVRSVASPVVEVGPGVSGADLVTSEEPPGAGPLPAIAAGAAALAAHGHRGDVLVVACDLPRLGPGILRFLAGFSAPASVVPVVAGRAQPLCARWSGPDLAAAAAAAAAGERYLRPLLERPGVLLLDERSWGHVAAAVELDDADVPADLDRLAAEWSPGVPGAPAGSVGPRGPAAGGQTAVPGPPDDPVGPESPDDQGRTIERPSAEVR